MGEFAATSDGAVEVVGFEVEICQQTYSFSNSDSVRNACLRMLRSVPLATSRCFGTVVVTKPFATGLANLTWLPV